MKFNKESLIDLLDDMYLVARIIIYLLGAFLLFVTIPIWYIPYIIYKKIKQGYI